MILEIKGGFCRKRVRGIGVKLRNRILEVLVVRTDRKSNLNVYRSGVEEM